MSSHRALVIHAIQQPIKFIDRPTPIPKDDEILIKVAIVGLNPHDAMIKRLGAFVGDNLPSPFGIDLVGQVASFGSKVTKYQIGDRVFAIGGITPDGAGTQEYCVVPALQSALLPRNFSPDEAATFPLNALTMMFALFHETGLNLNSPFGSHSQESDYSSETILIIGGGSATGKFGIQLARLAKFKNIITIASKSGESELKGLGATVVIDRNQEEDEIEAQIRAMTGDNLLLAVDCVGRGPHGQTLGARALSNTKKGTVAVLVRSGGIDESRIGSKAAGYVRQSVFCDTGKYPDFTKEFFEVLPELIEDGDLTPTTFQVVEGLNAEQVDGFLDSYSEGLGQVKPHIHVDKIFEAK